MSKNLSILMLILAMNVRMIVNLLPYPIQLGLLVIMLVGLVQTLRIVTRKAI